MKWYEKIFFRIARSDLSYEEAMDIYKKQRALLIDVRTPEEYKKNHLKDAVNVPFYEIENIGNEIRDKDEIIMLYCKTGKRSDIAKEVLMQNGYRNVYTVKVKI